MGSRAVVVSLVLVGWFAHSIRGDETFRAGTAEIDITPSSPMPMWGYGARHQLLATGVRDALLAKAVVIEAGGTRLGLVGLDLGRSLGEPHLARIRAAIRDQAGVEWLVLSGSHTHHGPVLELKDAPGKGQGTYDAAVRFVPELERRVIEVIVQAASRLQPARWGWSSSPVDFNRNRHARVEPKPRDPELTVIRLDDLQGQPLAVLVNFSAHPTLLDAVDLRWSADYPGAMRRHVEQVLGASCVFLQGAAGDLSPQTASEDHLGPDDPRWADLVLDADQAAAIQAAWKFSDADLPQRQRNIQAAEFRMESFGRRLGGEVVRLARQCTPHTPERPSVRGKYQTFDFGSRVNFHNPALRVLFGFAFFPELAAAAAADFPDNRVPAQLTTVLINDELALVGGSGEFFCSHALRLKERSYAVKTLFVGYCNGHHMYFPTIEAVSQGGYGADPEVSWVEVGAGEQMMNQALIDLFSWLGKIGRSAFAP
ncbi:MAG: hypothetical protein AB7F89_21965 [Pirellulaceae bacterium]